MQFKDGTKEKYDNSMMKMLQAMSNETEMKKSKLRR